MMGFEPISHTGTSSLDLRVYQLHHIPMVKKVNLKNKSGACRIRTAFIPCKGIVLPITPHTPKIIGEANLFPTNNKPYQFHGC